MNSSLSTHSSPYISTANTSPCSTTGRQLSTACSKKNLPWLMLALLLSSAQSPTLAAWQQQQRDIMGTRVSVELWHGEAEVAASCSARVFSEMDRIDSPHEHLSRQTANFPTSIATPPSEAVSISDELLYLLRRSIHFSEISAGAFDITYASIGYAYDYRKQQKAQRPGGDSKNWRRSTTGTSS